MAINNLNLKIAAEKSIIEAHNYIAPLKFFATSFNEEAKNPGDAVLVPVFALSAVADFDPDTNNYAGSEQGVSGTPVTLNQHKVKSVYITDRQVAETNIDFFEGAGRAIGDKLGQAVVGGVLALVGDASVTLSASFTTANSQNKQATANLYAIADENGIDPRDAVVVLPPAKFAGVLSQLDANVYGGWEAIRDGLVPNLYGFYGVFSSTQLPAGVGGAIIHREALGIASRYLEPMDGVYEEVAQVKDDKSGFTIGFRMFGQKETGRRYIAGECLYGAALLQPTKIVKLIGA